MSMSTTKRRLLDFSSQGKYDENGRQMVQCQKAIIIVGNEFLGVFPGELLAISLVQATIFSTDTLRDALPISISLFRIAPAKLNDILDKSLNRTSASPSGAPMLFVRKKDESL
ncbi:hypothetical protein MTR67_051051 [Solanum verrucosum]|uniref:Uncharacterized protein n=1 Tax=Solanum verrucosum TaxID=315347 RepID=A0AAF0V6G9_SOLVR|nr:hypothetical protein MTR67_051051 [Solanum verrucosum]